MNSTAVALLISMILTLSIKQLRANKQSIGQCIPDPLIFCKNDHSYYSVDCEPFKLLLSTPTHGNNLSFTLENDDLISECIYYGQMNNGTGQYQVRVDTCLYSGLRSKTFLAIDLNDSHEIWSIKFDTIRNCYSITLQTDSKLTSVFQPEEQVKLVNGKLAAAAKTVKMQVDRQCSQNVNTKMNNVCRLATENLRKFNVFITVAATYDRFEGECEDPIGSFEKAAMGTSIFDIVSTLDLFLIFRPDKHTFFELKSELCSGFSIITLGEADETIAANLLSTLIVYYLGLKPVNLKYQTINDLYGLIDGTSTLHTVKEDYNTFILTAQEEQDLYKILDTRNFDCLVREAIAGVQSQPELCGNGLIDPGETCDCIYYPTELCSKCCNPTTCQLVEDAECGSGPCCNPFSCSFYNLTDNHVCRPAVDPCDLDEKCNGSSAACPPDVTFHDGLPCDENEGHCIKGKCGSTRLACDYLFTNTTPAPLSCYSNNVAKPNERPPPYANCGPPLTTFLFKQPVNCSFDDRLCGSLYCSVSSVPKRRFGYSTQHINGHCLTQYWASSYLSLTRDFGMVPDGAKCGANKICLNQKCVPLSTVLEVDSCPDTCSNTSHVCDSQGNCLCADPTANYPDCPIPIIIITPPEPQSFTDLMMNIEMYLELFIIIVSSQTFIVAALIRIYAARNNNKGNTNNVLISLHVQEPNFHGVGI